MLFKTLLIATTLLTMTMPALANESSLKAEIKRLKQENHELMLKNGDLEVEVDALNFKLTQEPVVVEHKVPVFINAYKSNKISLLSGVGPKSDLKGVGSVHGVQYLRLLTPKLHFGAQVQTNETVLISIGREF